MNTTFPVGPASPWVCHLCPTVAQSPSLRWAPVLGFMLCCDYLQFLITFEPGDLPFHFALGLPIMECVWLSRLSSRLGISGSSQINLCTQTLASGAALGETPPQAADTSPRLSWTTLLLSASSAPQAQKEPNTSQQYYVPQFSLGPAIIRTPASVIEMRADHRC